MATNYDTIILRFRDLVTSNDETIQKHQSIIIDHEYVWWAWWKKGNETLPVAEFADLGVKAEGNTLNIFLVDSGQNKLYIAECSSIKIKKDNGCYSPEKEKTPEYYRDKQYYAWFKINNIEACDEEELKKYSYVNVKSLFISKDEDYSEFDNKKVHSIKELIQQNRTVWFIRKATDNDLNYEIILLNAEHIQPKHFSKRFYQSSGNTILWLSDLHLSDSEFKTKTSSTKWTLVEHIKNSGVKLKDIDGLIISGDITSYGKKEGFDEASLLLLDINRELTKPLSSENIIICPGNHDFGIENGKLEDNVEPKRIATNSNNAEYFSNFYNYTYNLPPNEYFACGKKLLLSSGHAIEIVALNSLILQQYTNFESHGFISQEQLDFVTNEMEWTDKNYNYTTRIVVMHHHYLPTCYTEKVDTKRASSVIYDADRLMQWLIKYNVRLLLHGHKHKSFFSQINYPANVAASQIDTNEMKTLTVVGMGSTGARTTENKLSTITITEQGIVIDFYKIYSDESSRDTHCQKFIIPL